MVVIQGAMSFLHFPPSILSGRLPPKQLNHSSRKLSGLADVQSAAAKSWTSWEHLQIFPHPDRHQFPSLEVSGGRPILGENIRSSALQILQLFPLVPPLSRLELPMAPGMWIVKTKNPSWCPRVATVPTPLAVPRSARGADDLPPSGHPRRRATR